MKSKFIYPVLEFDVIDGDSIRVRLDMGFSTYHKVIARLYGADTPELRRRAQKKAAQVAKEYTQQWFDNRSDAGKEHTIMFECVARDKYAGRVCGDFFIFIPNGDDGVRRFGKTLGTHLRSKGVARFYLGGKKEKWLAKELKAIEDLKLSPDK